MGIATSLCCGRGGGGGGEVAFAKTQNKLDTFEDLSPISTSHAVMVRSFDSVIKARSNVYGCLLSLRKTGFHSQGFIEFLSRNLGLTFGCFAPH